MDFIKRGVGFLRLKKKEFLLFIVSSIFAFLIGFSLWEIYLLKGYWHGAMPTQFDSQLGWSNIPNNSILIKGVKYSTNSLGFRSKEVNPKMKHLALVGDSVTWGLGVDDDKTASNFLERKLKDYQVLNLGVSGYGLDQAYLNLERAVGFFKPKIIGVVVYTGNDLADTSTNSSYGKSKPLFVADKERVNLSLDTKFPPNPNSLILLKDSVDRYSCTNLLSLNLVGPKIRGWTQWSSIFNWFRKKLCDIRVIEGTELKYVVASLIVKFETLAKKHGAKIFFVLSPEAMDFRSSSELASGPGRQNSPFDYDREGLIFFQKLFRQMNLKYLDFSTFVKMRQLNVDSLYIDGVHYTPKGNDVFADAIYNFILSKVLKKSNASL